MDKDMAMAIWRKGMSLTGGFSDLIRNEDKPTSKFKGEYFYDFLNIPTASPFKVNHIKLDATATGSNHFSSHVSLVTVICDHTIYVPPDIVSNMPYMACDSEILYIDGSSFFSFFVFCLSSSE